jgi:hypothetical protein
LVVWNKRGKQLLNSKEVLMIHHLDFPLGKEMIVANGKVLVAATLPNMLSKLNLGIHATHKKEKIFNQTVPSQNIS